MIRRRRLSTSFREALQAARADLERLQNEAQTYANRVVPDAKGRAAQIIQAAEGYKQQVVAEATGQSARFLKVYEEYKKAPNVTRERIYLETMERILGNSEKLIYDGGSTPSQGVVPSAAERADAEAATPGNDWIGNPRQRRCHRAERSHAMRSPVTGIIMLLLLLGALLVGYSSVFTVDMTEQALVVRLGKPVDVVTDPGLHFKAPFIDTVIDIDKRILDLENPSQEVIASDQKRLVVDAFARYRIKDALHFYQSVGSIQAANIQLTTLLNASLRRVLGEVTFIQVVRDEREALMARIRDQLDQKAVVTVSRWSTCGSAAPTCRSRTARRSTSACRPNGNARPPSSARRARRRPRNSAPPPIAEATVIVAEANSQGEQIRGTGDAERNRLFAEAYTQDPGFFAFYRSMLAYESGLKSADTRFLLAARFGLLPVFLQSVG